MPLSHTCPQCGMELCRLRAAPGGTYALAIVVCPRCESAAVRRRHPVHEGWRAFLRIFAASRRFVLQIALCLVFTLLFSAFLQSLRFDIIAELPTIRRWWNGDDPNGFELMRRQLARSGMLSELLAWVCYATGLGAWLVAGFAHWRRWAVLPSWIAAMAVIFAAIGALDWSAFLIDTRLRGVNHEVLQPSHFAWAMLLALASIPLAIPGAAMGLGLLALGRAARRRAFRKKLARLRRRRQG